ncbi:MAG: copper amine oxidase N-terminal domain-containing protein [Clostridia bacterium]
MKKFSFLTIVTIALILLPVLAQASCNILTDGSLLVATDAAGNMVEPFVFEGTTYVPVRAVSDVFGTEVFWDGDTMTVYIGTKEGSPVLNDHVNIFVNGKEFIAKNSLGEEVYPILKDGSTFLPLRAIGELFGKNVTWDQDNLTAILTTPITDGEIKYLSACIDNTSSLPDLKVDVTFKGELLLDSVVTSSVSTNGIENYTRGEFSLATFLPEDYMSCVSYLSEGKYFIHVPSDKFSQSPYVQKVFLKREIEAKFSPIYIYLSTKGGYITSMDIYTTTDIAHGGVNFAQNLNIKGDLIYPDTFSFPVTPYPDKELNEGEEAVSGNTSENSDITDISAVVKKYMDGCIGTNPAELIKLLHNDDYVNMFYYKSDSQYKLLYSVMERKLKSLFENYGGEYTVDSIGYINNENSDNKAEKTIKVTLTYMVNDGDQSKAEEHIVTFIKVDGSWYLDPEVLNSYMR